MKIRRCRPEDLRPLEWDGEFTHDRAIIAQTFARTREDRSVMLVAEVRAQLVGQVWLDLARPDTAYLWALRVRESWRGRRLGSQLLAAAERLAAAHGYAAIELDVERANHHASHIYVRRGYVVTRRDDLGHVRMRKRLTTVPSDRYRRTTRR